MGGPRSYFRTTIAGSRECNGRLRSFDSAGKYTLRWKNGFIDTLSLINDGNKLDGTNNGKYPTYRLQGSATRQPIRVEQVRAKTG